MPLTKNDSIDKKPLETGKVWPQLFRFAIPAMISLLVGAIYNITDQVFIGRIVGMYGNAATNVAMPLVTLISALSTLIGFGASANFSLNIGAGNKKNAGHFAGNAISLSVICGISVMVLTLIFLNPLTYAFGATENTLSLSKIYIGITAIGFPLLLFSNVGSNLIRSDGSPTLAMGISIVGAVINVGLDALFMFVFGWGIMGAALATVIGQMVSAGLTLYTFMHFKSVKLAKKDLRLRRKIIFPTLKLGTPGFFGNFTSMAVQITMNNVMNIYGGLSIYGSDIPFAVMAVVSKINILVYAINAGFAIGANPMLGQNIGAKNYARTREIFIKTTLAITVGAIAFTTVFQLFPRQLVGIFGNGSAEYFEFAKKYLRIYLLLMPICGLSSLCSFFITTIGKPAQGFILSISRQGIPLIILAISLPMFFGIDGILWAGPVSDGIALLLTTLFIIPVMRELGRDGKKISIKTKECEA